MNIDDESRWEAFFATPQRCRQDYEEAWALRAAVYAALKESRFACATACDIASERNRHDAEAEQAAAWLREQVKCGIESREAIARRLRELQDRAAPEALVAAVRARLLDLFATMRRDHCGLSAHQEKQVLTAAGKS